MSFKNHVVGQKRIDRFRITSSPRNWDGMTIAQIAITPPKVYTDINWYNV
jgi:hypothetical protein